MTNSAIKSSSTGNWKQQKNKVIVKLSAIVLLFAGIFLYNPTEAQSVNISSHPLWGPTGHDYVEYYYLPQEDMYYYVPTGQYIYQNGPNWQFSNSMPSGHKVNLYTTYKVVVNEPKPYLQNNVYKVKYAKYKNGGPQQMAIRDSHEEKYYVVKGHPNNGKAKGNNSNIDNSNHSNHGQPKIQKVENHHHDNGGGNGGEHKSGGNGGGKKH